MFDVPAPLIAILGVLLSAFFLLYVHSKNAKRTAAAKYRAALLKAFSGLYPIPSNWPRDIDSHLREIFPELQVAVAEYRTFIPWYSRKKYDYAWFVYRLDKDGREIDKQLYFHYMGFRDADRPTSDPKQEFHCNVSRLMAFASET
jgi:hypothetical protein